MTCLPAESDQIRAQILDLLGHERAYLLTARERHKLWNFAKPGTALFGAERTFIAQVINKIEGRAV